MGLEANANKTLVYVDIYFKDGSSFSAGYLQDNFKAEYMNLIAGQINHYVIDFEYPEDNTVTVCRKESLRQTGFVK